MQLDDPLLPVLLAICAILTLVGIVVFWVKLSASRFRTIFLRVVVLVALNIFIIAAVGVQLNNYGSFYSSWGELLGVKQTPTLVVDQSKGKINSDDLKNAKFTPDGSAILRRIIRGQVAGITNEIYLSLPPSYVQALKENREPRQNYRVVEYFSGYPGHVAAWVKGMNVVGREDEAHKRGTMPEVISVFPQTNIYPHFDTECMNIPGGPQIESWISQDVVSFINSWLNLQPQRWAAIGYSTGGWCATMLALRNPSQYSIAASIAGYYTPEVAHQVSGASRQVLKREYDLHRILDTNPPNAALFIVNPTDDRNSHFATTQFIKRVNSPVNVTEYQLTGAGHNFNAWKRLLNPMLDWLGKNLNVEMYK